MLSLPHTPLEHTNCDPPAETSHASVVQKIVLKHPHSMSTTSYISELTDYLDLIVGSIRNEDATADLSTYSERIIVSVSCPWKKVRHSGEWSLKDELMMTITQLSLGLCSRGVELVYIGENWANTVKLFKRALSYLSFIKVESNIWECSLEAVSIYSSIAMCAVQLGVLKQKLTQLKQMDFEISKDFNVASLSRVAIWINDGLNKDIQLIQKAQFKLKESWLHYLQLCLRYVQGLIGVLLSVDSYNQNRLGESIGWLAFGLDYIRSHGDHHENKVKQKFTVLKQKIGSKRLKLDQDFYKAVPDVLKPELLTLFEFCEILDVKYQKQNNQLSFDRIVDKQTLLSKMPLGRPIPMDIIPWTPFAAREVEQSGYF
jgi:hypothetical protein